MGKNNKAHYTSIGGQAVIEGVLMRGPQKTAIAIRMPDGSISTDYMDISYIKDKNKIFTLPIIRGIVSFIDSIKMGYKALNISAEKSLEDEEIKKEKEKAKKDSKIKKIIMDKLTTIIMIISSVLGVALAIGLFFMLPTYIYNLFDGVFGSSMITRSVIEGLMRIFLFLLYILVCSQLKDIKRVFMYHGAEHKSIFCYESRQELTVENVKKFKRFHPRCGTSFLVVLLIVGIIVGFFIPFSNPVVRSAVKILCIPIVVGIGYEFIRICGKYDNLFTKIISAPGLWVQRITTKEPSDEMIEVAISSLKSVIPNDNE